MRAVDLLRKKPIGSGTQRATCLDGKPVLERAKGIEPSTLSLGS
jgi:hypothetical protein